MRKKLSVLLTACVLGLAVAAVGCGGSESTSNSDGTSKIRLLMDYIPNANHVALFWAQNQGVFEKHEVEVELIPPSDMAAPLKLLAQGRGDLAISYEPQVMLGIQSGQTVKAVGSAVPVPLAALIAPASSSVKAASDLGGTTLGWPGIPYDEPMIYSALEEGGVEHSDVEIVNLGFNLVPPLMSGKVDSLLGGFSNTEAILLEDKTGEPATTISVSELGVPTYDEVVFVADDKRLSDSSYSEAVERFLAAYYEADEAVKADAEAAIENLGPEMEGSDEYIQKSTMVTLDAMKWPEGSGPGCMSESDWNEFSDWMVENDQLESPVPADQAMSNQYLPDKC